MSDPCLHPDYQKKLEIIPSTGKNLLKVEVKAQIEYLTCECGNKIFVRVAKADPRYDKRREVKR